MSVKKTVLLVGCGKMGGALLARWREKQPAGITNFLVIDPHASNGEALPALGDLAQGAIPDIIVFAVKPQHLSGTLPAYAGRFGVTPLYLSVAAGKTLAFYKRQLGDDARVVRVMPNTPALIGQGVSALCASPALPDADRQLATALMAAAGTVEWLEDEGQMDAVTALSGCGPAYVFLFLESLARAAVALGLPEPLAKSLAMQTVSGSAALAAQGADPAALRRQVASPGGSTEAALKVLMEDDALGQLMLCAMKQAALRSAELSA